MVKKWIENPDALRGWAKKQLATIPKAYSTTEHQQLQHACEILLVIADELENTEIY